MRNEADRQYLNVVKDAINGYYAQNRTGIATYKVPHKIMEFNLQKAFPIGTTKFVAFKTATKEMLWIYRDQSNNVAKLQEQNVHVWDEWQLEDGTIGKAYGYQISPTEKLNKVIKVKKAEHKVQDKSKVQKTDGLKKGYGVGFLGDRNYKNISPELEKKLISTWSKMLKKCYDETGLLTDVFVDERWFNFTNFVYDIRYISNWSAKQNDWNNYELDIDYYGANYYSKETCVWLHSADKKAYKNVDPFYIIHPDGHKELSISKSMIALKYGVSTGTINKILNGVKKDYKGYSFEHVEDDGSLYRYQLPLNQINNLINTLKNNDQDRRMMMTMWKIEDLNEMALQPCCFQTLWDVTDNKLNCMLTQRSGDLGLGVPFNTTQYAVLIHMIAQVTGLKPGLFTHIINNAHVYENHIDGLKLQLSRENDAYEAPEFWINPEIKDFYDFTADDVKLIDYKHHGKIDMGEVAV